MSAPNPNRYAAPAEAMILRGEIAAHMEARRTLEKRAASAASTLQDTEVALQAAQEARDAARRIVAYIEQQERSVDELVLVAQGLLHPIRRLPDEVLSMIFEVTPTVQSTATRADSRLPFAVSAVCRRWRAVGLSTPALWSTVRCEVPAITDRDAAKRWASYFRAHCDRSRDLNLYVDAITNEIDPSIEVTGALWLALSRVHIRSKRFSVCCRRFTPTMREWLSLRAPYLEELAFEEPDDTDRPLTTSRLTLDTPCLKTLVYRGDTLPSSADGFCCATQAVNFTVSLLTTVNFIDLFRIHTGVQVVDLTAKVVADLRSPGPIVIAAQRLEAISLVVGGCLIMDLNVAQSFSFPSLQTASLQIAETLDHNRDSAVLSAFIASAFRTITSLELYNPLPGMDQGLAACMDLEDLTVHLGLFGEHAQSFCLALSVSDPAGSRMCPRLRRLSVTASCFASPPAAQRFAHAMTAIANARCAASPNIGLRPLDKLAISSSVASEAFVERTNALQRHLNTILTVS